MIGLSDNAKKTLEQYLQRVRAYLRWSKSIDAHEVEQNITEHIENELQGVTEPISLDALDPVLKRLGSPEQWIADQKISWWRKVILRLQAGPEHWRLAHKQGNMNIGLRLVLCLPVILVWLSAAYFALKWFGHMARGTITYGNEATAILLPILSSLALVGTLGSFIAVVMTCSGRMKLRWQSIVFFVGLLFLWIIAGD